MKHFFDTAEKLEDFLDTDDGQEWLQDYIQDAYEVKFNEFAPAPTYIDEGYTQDALGFYVPSIWAKHEYGELKEIDGVVYSMKERFVLFNGEIEFELNNGESLHYTNYGHLEIWDTVK